MKVWKVVLIILASVIGAIGITMLGIYLSGGFDKKDINPENAFFADISTSEDGTITYSQRGAIPYNECGNFKLTIATTTESFNQNEMSLTFPTNQNGKYVKALAEDDPVSDLVTIYYAYNVNGDLIRFGSCGEALATHVTNGIVLVPKKVYLNRAFDVLACVAPDDLNGIVTEGVELYNVGGYSQLIASSTNVSIENTSAYINVDVPVESIEVRGITGNNLSNGNLAGLNEYLLSDTDENGNCEAGTEGLFSAVLKITPSRAVYKYGKNGANPSNEVSYKKVIFALDNDVNNSGTVISFANSENGAIAATTSYYGSSYTNYFELSLTDVFGSDFNVSKYNVVLNGLADAANVVTSYQITDNEKVQIKLKNTASKNYFELVITATPKAEYSETLTTLTKTLFWSDKNESEGINLKTVTMGVKFLTTEITGDVKIYARMFKNATEEDAIINLGITELADFYAYMANTEKGLSTYSTLTIKEIPLSGFRATDRYNNGDSLGLNINKSTIIYANNQSALANLGIEIDSTSQGSAQNKIKNILISLQYLKGDKWYDATQTNVIGGNTISPLFSVYSRHDIVTGASLGQISDSALNSLSANGWDNLTDFNFYRPIYLTASNMSYWEVTTLSEAEKLAENEITAVRIYVYYLNPDDGLMLEDEENYGPYYVELSVNEVIETTVEWKENSAAKSNETLGVGVYNERVFISNDQASYNTISLSTLAKITNIASNPTYKTIRYFVYSENANLENYLNVTEYDSSIPGISADNVHIYEVDSSALNLVVSNLTEDSIEFNLIFAIVENLPNGTPVMYNEAYRIISLPLGSGRNIVSIPFRIERALTLTDDSIEISNTSENITPYGEIDITDTDEKNNYMYFLQAEENNVVVSIKVSDGDVGLFKMLAKNGSISFAPNENLCVKYTIAGQLHSLPIEDLLLTVFEDAASLGIWEGYNIISNENEGGYTIFNFTLSTNNIDYTNPNSSIEFDEIYTNIDLVYKIGGINIPTVDRTRTVSTNDFGIYSGKVQNKDIHFGPEENEITGEAGKVFVTKTVEGNEFTTLIKQGEQNLIGSLIAVENGNYYLNVFTETTGTYNQEYIVLSSENDIVQLSWNNTQKRYVISFLSTGEATITLRPVYAHSNYQEISLTFDVTSNYTLQAKYYTELGNGNYSTDSRITNYTAGTGFEIIGKDNTDSIAFNELIGIFAIVGPEITDVTSHFTFTAVYDNVSSLNNKIIFTNNGFTIIEEIGSTANVTMYAASAEIGGSYQFNIVFKPNAEIFYTAQSQINAEKPIDATANSLAVFVETEFNIASFTYYEYDISGKTGYTSTPEPTKLLKYSINNESVVANANGIGRLTAATLNFDSNGNLFRITFEPVAELTRYTLIITWSDGSENAYDFIREITFYVSPNIELGNISGNKGIDIATTEARNITEDTTAEVLCLNNLSNPVLNGGNISINSNKIVMGNSGITIDLSRVYGDSIFNESKFSIRTKDLSGDNFIESSEISGNKELTEMLVEISYNGKKMYISFYAAPAIFIDSDGLIVTYKGEEYLALYAGQNITGAPNFFTISEDYNGSSVNLSPVVITLGNVATSSNILSLPRLYSKQNTANLAVGVNRYAITKTEEGLVKTTIVVSYGEEGNREFRTFKVLILPFEWSYLKYSNVSAENNVSTILAGASYSNDEISGVYETMRSGESKTISTSFLNNNLAVNFDSVYLISNTNRINYRLYLINNDNSETLLSGDSGMVLFGYDGSGKLCLKTQPFAGDKLYKIQFTYTGVAEGYPNAVTVFNYYIKIEGTQSININYPTNSATTESIIGDFSTIEKQIIYYDQFTEGQYQIDLESNLRNYNPNGEYVEVKISNGNVDTTKAYNKLYYSVYSATIGDVAIASNLISSYITLSNDGVITLKDYQGNSRDDVRIIVKVYTINGAENYYLIQLKNRPSSMTISKDGGALAMNSEISITEAAGVLSVNSRNVSKKFNLGTHLTINGIISGIHYALIDEQGNIKDAENGNMFIKNGSVYVVASASTQRAKLVIYTETEGILLEAKLVAESALELEYKQGDNDVYSDSTVNLTSLAGLKLTNNGTEVSKDAENLSWSIAFKNDENSRNYVTYTSGASFDIKPMNIERTISFTVSVWGASLPGTDENNPCTCDISMSVKPNIETTTAAAGEIDANSTHDWTLSNSFTRLPQSEAYKYEITYSWLPGVGEHLQINDTVDPTLISGNLSASSITTNILVGAVASERTIIFTVTVYKGTSLAEKVGDAFSTTYTLTVNPDVTATPIYPTYGVNINTAFEKEAVYHGDTSLNKVLASRFTTTSIPEGRSISYRSSNTSVISISNGNITVKEVDTDTEVIISVLEGYEIGDIDYSIEIATYTFLVSATPVHTVEFPETVEADKSSYTETIPDSEIDINAGSSTTNLFDMEQGTLYITTKADVKDQLFSFVIKGQSRYNWYTDADAISLAAGVTVYGIGQDIAKTAMLFLIDDPKDTSKTNPYKLVAPTDITSFDILGRQDDNSIATLNGGVLQFQNAAKGNVYAIKITVGTTITYYYVKVANNDGATPSYYKSINDTLINSNKNYFTLDELFAQHNLSATARTDSTNGYVTNQEMYTFSVSSEDMQNGGVILNMVLTQPQPKIVYYYKLGDVKYQLTNTAGEDLYTTTTSKQSTISKFSVGSVSYNKTKTVTIYNESRGAVGSYTYTIVYDCVFPTNSLDTIKNGTVTNQNTSNLYNDGELTQITEESQITKTIELTAGGTYNLISDVLKNKLNITRYNGGGVSAESCKFNITLSYGTYISNSGFINDKSALISLAKINNSQDWAMTPHGASNAGDIIHIVMTFGSGDGSKVYILRIKINPNVSMVALSSNGEYQFNSGATGKDIKLSDLITTNITNIADLKIVAVEDSDTQLISSGSGDNKAVLLEGSAISLSTYGVKLSTTILGGAKIKVKVIDKYGYCVTNTEGGAPITLTINYNTENGTAAQLGTATAAQIYEGDSFEFWAGWSVGSTMLYAKNDGSTNSKAYIMLESTFETMAVPMSGAAGIAEITSASGAMFQITYSDTKVTTVKVKPLINNVLASDWQLHTNNSEIIDYVSDTGKFSYPSGREYTVSVKQYTGFGAPQTTAPETTTDNKGISTCPIVIDNLNPSTLPTKTSLTISLGVTSELTDLIISRNNLYNSELPSAVLHTDGKKINYLSNVAYAGASALTGHTFNILLTVKNANQIVVETSTIAVNTSINEKYSVVLNEPYNRYPDIYLALNTNYTALKLFKIINNKDGSTTTPQSSTDFYIDNINENEYLTLNTSSKIVSFSSAPASEQYRNCVADGDHCRVNLSITKSEAMSYYYDFNYKVTTQYTKLLQGDAVVYGTYGKVIPGTNLAVDGFSEPLTSLDTGVGWGKGWIVADYYGAETLFMTGFISGNIGVEKLSGYGSLEENNAVKGLGAGESIIIAVKSNGQKIGEIKVTRATYYDLVDTTAELVTVRDGLLPFALVDGKGWGEDVKAVKSGTTTEENITGTLSGFFSYSIEPIGEDTAVTATISYSESFGCYIINPNIDTEIHVNVMYMEIKIGTITFEKGNGWTRTVG